MMEFRKRLVAGAVASALALGAPAVSAQTGEQAERLDGLFAELAEPGREDTARIEEDIARIWSQSGSPAMDFLFRRAREAMEVEDHVAAIEHLSALTDHAPGFAEGWNARATAFYMLGEYALSMADIERTLALNPRHFGALEGLATIFEETGRPEAALRALQAAQEINPNSPRMRQGVARLERLAGAVEL